MPRQRIYHRKKIKRGISLPTLLLILVMISVGIAVWFLKSSQEKEEFSMNYISTKEIPGFLQFTYYDEEEWSRRLGMEFTGALTYQKLHSLLELLNIEEYVVYEEKRAGKKVDRETWNQVYEQILDILDTSGKVSKEKLLLLKEPGEDSLETQMGIYQYRGSIPRQYQAYEVYVMEDKLLGILSELEDELAIENVYVTEMTDELKFLYKNSVYRIPIEAEGQISDTVCDIYMKMGEITRIQKKEDTIEGKLLTMEEDKIEIEGYGRIERAKELPVYQIYGERIERNLSDIVIGNMNISYIVAEKRVCAILLKEPAEIKNVRVLLLNESQGIGREEVYVTSSTNSHLSLGEEELECEADTVIKASDYLAEHPEESLKIEGEEESLLYFCDESGSKTSYGYTGSFEIRKYEEGYVVVNALPLEEYLCGVVPSEMPAGYPIEALKAQAVCARSYASIQLLKGAYAKYGAHMDDSVNYQVYNKQERSESTTQAVNDTYGKVLSRNGEILEAYYYSTSYGHSGSYESWNLDNDGSLDYLKGTWLKDTEPELDLSDEAAFSEYIQSQDEECYDSFAKYFRWNAVLDLEEKSGDIKEKINSRKAAKPDSIQIYPNKVKEKDKGKEVTSASALGNVLSFVTDGRNVCGGVEKLTVNFENGKVDILDEYSIRIVLGCAIESVTWKDGSSDVISVLPSSYFAVTASENEKYTLCGGGYGHGIGLSQNGAKGMAEKDYTYEQILEKFYNQTELTDLAELKGETS